MSAKGITIKTWCVFSFVSLLTALLLVDFSTRKSRFASSSIFSPEVDKRFAILEDPTYQLEGCFYDRLEALQNLSEYMEAKGEAYIGTVVDRIIHGGNQERKRAMLILSQVDELNDEQLKSLMASDKIGVWAYAHLRTHYSEDALLSAEAISTQSALWIGSDLPQDILNEIYQRLILPHEPGKSKEEFDKDCQNRHLPELEGLRTCMKSQIIPV